MAYFEVFDDPMFGMGRAKSKSQSAKLVANLMTSASWIKFGGSFFYIFFFKMQEKFLYTFLIELGIETCLLPFLHFINVQSDLCHVSFVYYLTK